MQSIIRAQFEDESIQITDASIVDDVPGWDSVAHVQIIVAIEGQFGILLDTDEYMDIANVGEMVECICKKLTESPPAAPNPLCAADCGEDSQ